jgi:cation:H+ antiporter
MIYYSAALLVGFLVLFKSADQFVIGSVATARNFSISPMVIGLTIVALGTSAPEIFVSTASSLRDTPELAIGNAIGSNIANIGMVLGITALFVPLKFRVDILRNDVPILIFVTLCAGATLIDFKLGIWDGLLLLFGLLVFLFRLAVEHRKSTSMEQAAEIRELSEIPDMSNTRAVTTFLLSLVFLLLSSELLVWAVANIAQILGVSELLIGLTVIAVGTSLPELVVSMTSALKAQTDMAIGNIVGSNIFNILAVLAIPCVISPTEIEFELLWRDYIVMLGLTFILVVFAYRRKTEAVISRLKGLFLLCIWVGYLVVLYRSTVA